MEDRVALVTGCSSGLGFEVCNYLLDEGYLVVGCSRGGVEILHGKYIDVITDVSAEKSVEELFETVRETTNGLDLIVNCAGIMQASPIEEMSTREFSEHLDTNVLGVFHILKHCNEFLIEGRTHIINISSAWAERGGDNMSAFTASKSGLNSLVNCCRKEWKKKGTRLTTLVPGRIETQLWKKVNMEFAGEANLRVDDFLYIFEMVINSPPNIQFPKLVFYHKDDLNHY